MTTLIEKIEFRAKQQNLSVSELERKAGLKIHSVRNILKGRIKKPSAETLFAVAGALECSILDLLEGEDKNRGLVDTPHVEISVKDFIILEQSIEVAANIVKDRKVSLSLEVFLQACSKIYLYSISDDPQVVDPKFAKWVLGECHFEGKNLVCRNHIA